MKSNALMILGVVVLLAPVACTNPDSPSRSRTGIPAPLDPNRPTPGRTVTRKVDSARARVQRACRMAQALGLPQIGCDEAEAILDVPGHLGAR